MAVVSSVPAVKNALYDRLAARAGLISAGLLVSYGPPLPTGAREYVWIAGVPEHEQEQIGGGAAPRQRKEDYILEVLVSVLQEGRDQQACTERAYAIAAEVEDEIADDPRINSTISEGGRADVVGLQLVEPENDRAREAKVLIRIHCVTLIGP